MRLLIASAIVVFASGTAFAQSPAPDLKGTWTGTFQTVIYGHNPHHPGSETVANPPRVREIPFTVAVDGQEGNLLWGSAWSDPAQKDPFAATFTPDGQTIIGADSDGTINVTIAEDGRLNFCYSHTGLSPSGSIVATCGILARGE